MPEPRLLYAAHRVEDIGDWAYLVQFAAYRHDQQVKSAVLETGDGRILQLVDGLRRAGMRRRPTDDLPIAPPRTVRSPALRRN